MQYIQIGAFDDKIPSILKGEKLEQYKEGNEIWLGPKDLLFYKK